MTTAPRRGRLNRPVAEQIAAGTTRAGGALGMLLAVAAAPPTGTLPGEDAIAAAFSARPPVTDASLPRRQPERRRLRMPVRIAVTSAALTLVATAGVAVAGTAGVLSGLVPSGSTRVRGGGPVPADTRTPRISPSPGTPAPSASTPGTTPATASSGDHPADLVALCRRYLKAIGAGHTPAPDNHAYAPLRAAAGDDIVGYCQTLTATTAPTTPPAHGTTPGESPTPPGAHHGGTPPPHGSHASVTGAGKSQMSNGRPGMRAGGPGTHHPVPP